MDVSTQLEVLKNGVFSNGKLPLFKEKLKHLHIERIQHHRIQHAYRKI